MMGLEFAVIRWQDTDVGRSALVDFPGTMREAVRLAGATVELDGAPYVVRSLMTGWSGDSLDEGPAYDEPAGQILLIVVDPDSDDPTARSARAAERAMADPEHRAVIEEAIRRLDERRAAMDAADELTREAQAIGLEY